MAWIEEEREKRSQEKEQEKERALAESEKWKLKVKHVEDFWSYLLKANEALPEDFRLNVENNKINGKTIKMKMDDYTISALNNSGWAILSITYDTEKQRLVGKKHNVLYEIDKNSVKTLLRNLCTDRDIIADLKFDPSIIAANKNAMVGLFVFIVFDLIFSAINSKSADEFFLMIFAFPFVIFIIVKIAQFIRMVFS